MIEIYASRLSDAGKETYKTRKRQTLAEWLYHNGIDRKTDLTQLAVSLYVNGDLVLPWQWPKYEFGPKDHVEIYREPKSGFEVIGTSFLAIFAAKAVLSALMPKLPSTNSSNRGQGAGLDEASAKGNKVKINDVVPECAGFNPARYPDYAVPPRRYFASPREQRIEMLLNVGKGSYSIPPSTVKVGQTPLLSLGSDAGFNIYPPSSDLSAEPAHYYWYTAPEVGASSTGTAGLELTVSTNLTTSATASVFAFNSFTVSIPSGAGTFPADWTSGLMLNIVSPYGYTITDGTGTGGRDIINGDITQLGLVAGDTIQIAGDNAGDYTVFSATATQLQLDYASGAAGTGLVTGIVTMSITFRGMRYRILTATSSALLVERIKSNGTADSGWPGWTSMSSNLARVQLDTSNLQGGYRGPFPACPAGEVITAIEWDTLFPSGIVGLGSKGDMYVVQSAHDMEYRDMALGGAWTVIAKQESGNTLDSQGYTYRVNLPYPMRAEVRVKREPKVGGANSAEVNDTVMWLALKGLMPSSSPTSYPGVTQIACNIRGGDRLSSQTENLISVECTRILPVLRGGAWQAPQPTREISAWIGHVIRNVGYSDTTDIDLAELNRLESTRWTPRGDTYDRIVTDSGTVKSNLIECLQAGFSELTIDRGVLVPVRDEPRGPVFEHVYNPQVMLEPLSYEFSAPNQPDDFDGVDVEYFDHGTRQNETVQCRLPGDLGTRVEQVKLDGVCVRYKAWRIGMRRRRSHLYRQRQYSFKTELDALNSAYMDYVALGVSTPGYGQSALVESYQAGPPVTIGSSEPLDWLTPGVYKVVLRRKDGTASGPYIASRIDDYTFTIPTMDFVPDLSGQIDTPPVIQFGHESTWCFPALISEVKPSGTRTCSVSAVNYDVRMYADDDNFPPT
jgi:hypothetical protein